MNWKGCDYLKVLWFVNITLPEFSIALGQSVLNQGGWLPSLVDAIRFYSPQLELVIASAGNASTCATVRGVEYVQLNCRKKVRSAICQLIRKVNPDVIHIHGSEGYWATLPKETFMGCPVVLSLQGIISGCYPHYAGNLTVSETFSVANLPNMFLTRYWIARAAGIWRTRKAVREQAAFKNFDAFLGRTEWDEAWTKYLAPNARYFHVGEILRSPFYQGGRTQETIVPHTIFCGAAFGYPLKGGHWLLKAVAALRRKYPDIMLRVANARKVEKSRGIVSCLKKGEYHRYLSRLICELKLEDNVVLLPSLTADEVAEELAHADVFCLPSLCENSPNSLGEAMLMKCPCIATDVGGTQTLLKNEIQGLLVPSGDPAILAYKIDSLFEDKSLAAQYAASAYEDAISRYNPQKVVSELLSAYKWAKNR